MQRLLATWIYLYFTFFSALIFLNYFPVSFFPFSQFMICLYVEHWYEWSELLPICKSCFFSLYFLCIISADLVGCLSLEFVPVSLTDLVITICLQFGKDLHLLSHLLWPSMYTLRGLRGAWAPCIYKVYLVYRELCLLVQYTCPIVLPLISGL